MGSKTIAPILAPSFGVDTFAKNVATNAAISGPKQVGRRNTETNTPTIIPTRIEKMDRFDVIFIVVGLAFKSVFV